MPPIIKPYTIHIPDSKLTHLQQKLSLTDFPTYSLKDAGWKYGTPLYSSLPPSYQLTNSQPLIQSRNQNPTPILADQILMERKRERDE
jgi:hypothetical protein